MPDSQPSKRAAWALPILGGIMHALAFPPFGLMLLIFASTVPLLLSLRQATGRQSFARGYLFGLAFGLPNMLWLFTFVGKWTSSVALGAIPWLLVCLAFAVYFGIFGWLAGKAIRLNALWTIPFLWAGVEVFRSKIPVLYYPWSLTGSSLFRVPILLQSARLLGEFFIGAWVVAIATLLCMFLVDDRQHPRKAWTLVGAVLLVLGISVSLYIRPETGRTFTAAAVQPGVDMAFTPAGQQPALLAEKIPQALKVGAGRSRDVTVLPEGISRWRKGDREPMLYFESIPNMVLGGKRSDTKASYQSAFALDSKGKWSSSDKTRLVIFGEYVPFRDHLPFLDAFGLPDSDLRPGLTPQILDVDGLKVGPVLCFEALFEEVSRYGATHGADVLAVMSIDDWYQGTGAIDALIGGAVLRSIENGLPVVRSASLGPSLIIDSRGNIVAFAATGKTTTLFADVTSEPSGTGPLRLGFMFFCVAVCAVVMLWRTRDSTSA
jgi:apolipoprotein N-acyltransferase